MEEPFDLTSTPVHLGLGATAEPLPGFSWDAAALDAYSQRTSGDGVDGRLVTMATFDEPWPHWEVHPHGAELVVCTAGRVRLTQELDGRTRTVELGPGSAVVNPPGAWHIAEPLEPTTLLFVTAGLGTQHRPR